MSKNITPKKSKTIKYSRTKSKTKSNKNKEKEMDYEAVIHAFLLEKYLALHSMNYLDKESDAQEETLDSNLTIRKAPTKKLSKFYSSKENNVLKKSSTFLKGNATIENPKIKNSFSNLKDFSHNTKNKFQRKYSEYETFSKFKKGQ